MILKIGECKIFRSDNKPTKKIKKINIFKYLEFSGKKKINIKKKTKPPVRGIVLLPLIKLLWLDMLVWSIKILSFLNIKFNIKEINTTEIMVPIIFIWYY